MFDDPNYGQDLKSIRFWVSDDDHARLLIRLRHNKLAASQLFRAVIDGILTEEPNIMAFLDSYVLEHKLLNRNRFAKSMKLRKKGKETWKIGVCLTMQKSIFDLIAKEFPDL